MANVTLMGASYTDVPAVTLPQTGGGTVTFYENGGSPSATQHIIHLEFSDSTDTDIDVYYDDSLIGTMITAYQPSTWTYGNKTVVLAQLDNVTWYDKQGTWETMYNGNVDWYHESSGDYPYCWISSLSNVPIPANSVWKVTYANTEYVLTAKTSGQNVIIGNPKWGGGTDDGSGVPFYFVNPGWGAWTGALDVPNVASTYHFKIERLVT